MGMNELGWCPLPKEKDKETLQEERNLNRCYSKLFHYYLEGIKIKLRLRTHPEYFFEGVVKEIDSGAGGDGKVYTPEDIQKLKDDRDIQKKKGLSFFIENNTKLKKGDLIANHSKQLQYIQENDNEMGDYFILKNGDVETILNTYEVDASSIHPVEINPIAYFIRGSISEESRNIVKQRCNGQCELKLIGCNGRMEEVDHWIPVSRGGSEDISNLRGACSHCNKKKSGRLWEEIPKEEKI